MPAYTDHLISSQRRYDHFGTSPLQQTRETGETPTGADGRNRTGTAFATAPSRQRVYQFHHIGTAQGCKFTRLRREMSVRYVGRNLVGIVEFVRDIPGIRLPPRLLPGFCINLLYDALVNVLEVREIGETETVHQE